MFQSLVFFVLSYLFVAVDSQTGQILKPQNVSLVWISDFLPHLTWTSPQPSVENCTYEVIHGKNENDVILSVIRHPPLSWTKKVVMEGGFLHLSVKTVCNGISSEPLDLSISYPELVRNLQCYIYSSERAHCSWDPVGPTTDLPFFYWLANESGSVSIRNDTPKSSQECPLYSDTDGVRTGCDFQATIFNAVHISFNGTRNNTVVRNTFRKVLRYDVRPSALNWTVIKTWDKFLISWTPPDIKELSDWRFTVKYTECNEEKTRDETGKTSTELDVVSHCQYRMAIKAQMVTHSEKIKGETPWSDEKTFDADTDPNAMVFAAIFIPLMFAVLAVLTFVCYRKNKDNIFPKIPEPRDFLSDISDNNNKSTVRNLYIPAKEEENCKITLVTDPQDDKRYS